MIYACQGFPHPGTWKGGLLGWGGWRNPWGGYWSGGGWQTGWMNWSPPPHPPPPWATGKMHGSSVGAAAAALTLEKISTRLHSGERTGARPRAAPDPMGTSEHSSLSLNPTGPWRSVRFLSKLPFPPLTYLHNPRILSLSARSPDLCRGRARPECVQREGVSTLRSCEESSPREHLLGPLCPARVTPGIVDFSATQNWLKPKRDFGVHVLQVCSD